VSQEDMVLQIDIFRRKSVQGSGAATRGVWIGLQRCDDTADGRYGSTVHLPEMQLWREVRWAKTS
jgi:hypothetical protein